MKKSDLKSGMIIETRAGERALIVLNNCYGRDAVIFAENNWTDLDGFSEDLIWHNEAGKQSDFAKTVDIMKIYRPDLPTGFLSRKSKFSNEMELLWERKEEEKPILTLDGIEYSESTLRSIIKKATQGS